MFHIIDEHFFMPLASPNKVVYWECICKLLSVMDHQLSFGVERDVLVEEFSYEFFSGIRITDQGVGIAEEEIPLLFGRFYRGKTVHDKEGIGVGLYLAREIVEHNGGYIKVKSEVLKGSTFDICFPR